MRSCIGLLNNDAVRYALDGPVGSTVGSGVETGRTV